MRLLALASLGLLALSASTASAARPLQHYVLLERRADGSRALIPEVPLVRGDSVRHRGRSGLPLRKGKSAADPNFPSR